MSRQQARIRSRQQVQGYIYGADTRQEYGAGKRLGYGADNRPGYGIVNRPGYVAGKGKGME